MNKSPLHNLFADFGTTFGEAGGWEIPLLAGRSQEEEYNSIRTGAALLDRSNIGKLVLTGGDRVSWLQGMVSNDLLKLNVDNPVIDCFILNATGQIISDCRVVSLGDNLTLLLPRSLIDQIYERLQGFLVLEDVEITEQSDFLSVISIQGPQTTRDMAVTALEADGLVVQNDRTGSSGYDLLLKTTAVDAVARKLIDLGATPVGERAFEVARVESGIPLFGSDFTQSTLAPETGLQESHISYHKGCYVGQEIVARIQSRGHTNRYLTGFLIDGDRPPEIGSKLYENSTESSEIGWITSIAYSYAYRRLIAMGYIRYSVNEDTSAMRNVQIAHLDGFISAQVHELPFVHIAQPELVE